MNTSINDISDLKSFADNKVMDKPKSKEGENIFLGHILAGMFEEMIPEEKGWDDGNVKLFQGLYLAEILKDPNAVDSFGIGQQLFEDQNQGKKPIKAYQQAQNMVAEAA
ncbi:MAG: hypothetical protein Q8L85_06945 [Alphaproteobacteria bacterium]|nr:hypothetical protein [Alphaproteobacteria bacterium]